MIDVNTLEVDLEMLDFKDIDAGPTVAAATQELRDTEPLLDAGHADLVDYMKKLT